MAWASQELDAEVIDRWQADLPILASGNAAASTTVDPAWRESNWGAAAALAEAGYETVAAYDGCAYTFTRPETGAGTICLVFALDEVSFDVAAIVGHNFHELDGDVIVS